MNWHDRVFHDGLIDWDELERHNKCLELENSVLEMAHMVRCDSTWTSWDDWRGEDG